PRSGCGSASRRRAMGRSRKSSIGTSENYRTGMPSRLSGIPPVTKSPYPQLFLPVRFLHVPELRPQTKVALLLAVFAVTAMLYLAQDILMPFALAVLISFLLTPIVVKLESWRVGRTLSVVATAFIAFLMLGLALFVMAAQLLDL